MLKLLIIYIASNFFSPCTDARQDASFRQPVVHVATAEICTSTSNELVALQMSKAYNEATESKSMFDLNTDWIPEEEVCSGKRREA